MHNGHDDEDGDGKEDDEDGDGEEDGEDGEGLLEVHTDHGNGEEDEIGITYNCSAILSVCYWLQIILEN